MYSIGTRWLEGLIHHRLGRLALLIENLLAISVLLLENFKQVYNLADKWEIEFQTQV
jgi:hypothetical protein